VRKEVELSSYLQDSLRKLGEDAWALRTIKGYQGSIRQFKQFVQDYFPDHTSLIDSPSQATLQVIEAYIAYNCETANPKATVRLLREAKGLSYSQAELIRASLTYYYTYERQI